MVIIPPDPSALTDIEEGVEDDMTLSNLPQDIPGTIEVFTNHEDIDSEGSNDSDDQPLASKRIRQDFTRQTNPSWHKCLPSYTSTFQRSSEVCDRVNGIREELNGLSPIKLFENLFDKNVFDLIIPNTKLYEKQNNRHDFELDITDFKKF